MGIEGTLMHFMCQRLAAQKRKHRMLTPYLAKRTKKAERPSGRSAEISSIWIMHYSAFTPQIKKRFPEDAVKVSSVSVVILFKSIAK